MSKPLNPGDSTEGAPWLMRVRDALAIGAARTPHALLIHGQQGLGKRLLARSIARSLLCESPDLEARRHGGCGTCLACGWFAQGSHPDYRRVTSEAIAAAEGLDLADASGSDDEAEAATPRSKKAPSKEIKAEQIRALHGFLGVAAHRGGYRAVVIDPLEAVNTVAANGLLKMLEEPPPSTVFVLVADHLGRIAPTVVSRCRRVFVATPSAAEATAWLAAHGAERADEALALAGGAPFAAASAIGHADETATHRALLGFLERPGVDAALVAADALAKAQPSMLIRWMQQWVFDCVAVRLAGRVRYHPTRLTTLRTLVARVAVDALMALAERIDAVRRTVDHPLNTRLLLESLFVEYAEAMTTPRAAERPA